MKNNYKILVAEDEEYNYTLLMYILKKEGINVLWAKNGKEAVDQVEDDREIDLVIMDIKMPVMNGLDATVEIKKVRNQLPVIAVTAYALAEDRDICLTAGCDEFITKPINREHLLSVIYKLLKN